MTRVLLYSGGLDSYVAATLWRPDVLLYVALGHRYQEQELATIKASGLPVQVDDRLRLGDLERADAIIPLRNLYLLAIATHYGDTLALGALAGEDVNPDKPEAFRAQAAQVLTTCYAPSHWSAGMPVRVQYPLAQWTKTEMVATYLAQGGDPLALTGRTRSCYSPTQWPCGWCGACVRRYVALTLNGLAEATEHHPASSPYLADVRSRWAGYSDRRRREIAAAFPDLWRDAG